MEDSAPLPVVDHRVEGGGGHGQQGGAGMAISPQRKRTCSSALRRRPERFHGGPLVGRCPPPRDGGGWPLVGRCPLTRDGGGSGRLPWRSAKACGVARIAAHSRVQHALAVCRHTRACVRVRPVTEARP
jgi:hypothetical protein